MRTICAAIASCCLFASSSPAWATFIDLRGLDSDTPTSRSIVVDGIFLYLGTSPWSATLPSSATRFGVDSPGDLDVPDLLDGGNGYAEELTFMFGPSNAVLDSIVISSFDEDDAGEIIFKHIAGDPIPLSNGVNPVVSYAAHPGSQQMIRWRGENLPGGTRGFSIDGFNFHLTPEPSSFLLALGFATALAYWRLRRRS